MDNKCVKVGVGVLVYNKDGKFLLIRRAGKYGKGTWAPPGGHVDFGETAVETAKREVKEEAGMDIANVKVIGVTEDINVSESNHYLTVFLTADWAGGEMKKTDIEFSEAGWFDMEHLPGPLFISFKNFADGKLLP